MHSVGFKFLIMERKKHASILRYTRKIHRQTGIILFLFLMAIGITGVLLGWKKNVNSLQYPTQQGSSKNLKTWIPMDSLVNLAVEEIRFQKGIEISTEVDRIDARPARGILKVIFKDHFYSVQLDATTGEVLSFEHRTSDLIEQIHDGTIIDDFFGIPSGIFKLFYTSIMGSALVTFTLTGFWLWYGPRVMRRKNKE